MANRTHRFLSVAPLFLGLALTRMPAAAQVFVVGEGTATADIATGFNPTSVPLSDEPLTLAGRRDLVRNLEAEQGFAHRALPIGPGLVLEANGQFRPGPAEYRKMMYEKGQAAAPGDRVVITSVSFKGDSIVLDLNGGPYAKHRFLRHLQINDAQVIGDPYEIATGSRLTLHFEGGVPEISAPEVKALLQPVLDFRVQSGEQAYADTLPDPLKEAIAAHEVLVGMNHRMVLAALGAPDSKIREQQEGDAGGARYEEWIYGHVPQTVRFIRFQADRVNQVKIAALGKAVEVHNDDQVNGYRTPAPVHEIALGDKPLDESNRNSTAAPTLRRDGEVASENSAGKVQFPTSGRSSGGNESPIPPPPNE